MRSGPRDVRGPRRGETVVLQDYVARMKLHPASCASSIPKTPVGMRIAPGTRFCLSSSYTALCACFVFAAMRYEKPRVARSHPMKITPRFVSDLIVAYGFSSDAGFPSLSIR